MATEGKISALPSSLFTWNGHVKPGLSIKKFNAARFSGKNNSLSGAFFPLQMERTR